MLTTAGLHGEFGLLDLIFVSDRLLRRDSSRLLAAGLLGDRSGSLFSVDLSVSNIFVVVVAAIGRQVGLELVESRIGRSFGPGPATYSIAWTQDQNLTRRCAKVVTSDP